MCHFITLIAPTEDDAAVQVVMARHGRAADPIDNPSVRKVLRADERQYLTTRGHCDCGTVLGAANEETDDVEEELAKFAARMKRKGWSDTKIARAIEDRRKAGTRPTGTSDSLELWNTALHDLGEELNLSSVGLLVRFYSGAITTEMFDVSRRQVEKLPDWRDALASIKQDEVTIFPFW